MRRFGVTALLVAAFGMALSALAAPAALAAPSPPLTTGANDPSRPVTDSQHCDFGFQDLATLGGRFAETGTCVTSGEFDRRLRQCWPC